MLCYVKIINRFTILVESKPFKHELNSDTSPCEVNEYSLTLEYLKDCSLVCPPLKKSFVSCPFQTTTLRKYSLL